MIVNLPTPDGLNNTALKIYYRTWDELFRVLFDFTNFMGGAPDKFEEEWAEYLSASQHELQSVSALLQQSAEIALKARLCEVSPYLLLLDSGVKFAALPKEIDFSELKTIDSVDLPGAVNTLTAAPVSPTFVNEYRTMRLLRNKITHLGEAGVPLSVAGLAKQAVFQYANLWPNRKWLHDRLTFAIQARNAWLSDYKHTSPYIDIFLEWPEATKFFSASEFKALFGHKKKDRRFLCHICVGAGDDGFTDLDMKVHGTAYLSTTGDSLECIMCGGTFAVERTRCKHCGGNVLNASDSRWAGFCHSCGNDQPSMEEEPQPLAIGRDRQV